MKQLNRPIREVLVWPGIVFMFIGISVTLMSVTLFLAVTDESFGLEDAYYAKAVSWDESAADRAASEALGWSVLVDLAPEIDLSGSRAVMIVVLDDAGQPVDGTASAVYAFHHARRKEPIEFAISRIAPGRYAAGAPLIRDGLWQLRLRFARGDDVYSTTIDVSTDPDAGQGGESREH